MSKVIVTDSDKMGVSQANVKEHLRIAGNDEDAKLDKFIKSATTYLENYLGRYIKSTTIDYYLDSFNEEIELPHPGVTAVSSVKYTDVDGNEQVVSGSVYDTDLNSFKGLIYPAFNQQWPIDVRIHRNSVVIRYVCGWSTTPEDLQQAILLIVGSMYEFRENENLLTVKEIPNGVMNLISHYRVISI